MTITYLLETMGKTGGSIVLYNFMDQLTLRGHEVYAVFPTHRIKWVPGEWKNIINTQKKPSGVKHLIKQVLPKVPDRYQEEIKKLRFAKAVKGLLNNWEKTDITVSTTCMSTYAGVILANQTVSYYHMQHYEELFFKSDWQRQLARNSYYLPLFQIANSAWLKNLLEKNFATQPFLINPGIDLSLFRSETGPEKKYFSGKKDWVVVSFFDEEREWKGFNDGVQAMKKARAYFSQRNINITWKVFGLHAPTKEYDTEFEYAGAIFGEQLSRLYASADIVLLTSWYESFPLPPIEAMACGTLLITSQYGTEDYVEDGVNGLVSLPRDIPKISEKIIQAIENSQENIAMVKKGLETVENYTWQKRTDELEKLFLESSPQYNFKKYTLFDDIVNGRFESYMYEEFQIS